MKASLIVLVSTVMVIFIIFIGCATHEENKITKAPDEPLTLDIFSNKDIGMDVGSIWEPLIKNIVHGKPVLYADLETSYNDVRNGTIQGVMTDLSIVKVYLNTPEGSDMTYAEIPLEQFNLPMGAMSVNWELIAKFNTFLHEITEDGTLNQLQDYWFNSSYNLVRPMPPIETPTEKPTRRIKVATADKVIPFSYHSAEGELKGYCIDLMRRFAAKENYEVVYSTMDFGALLPTIRNGKADFAIANITITEERKQRGVIFTEPIYVDQVGILTLASKGE